MPEYESLHYWQKRYAKSKKPFDWMCDFEQLEPTILPLLKSSKPNNDKILVVGCGNANFSYDFVKNSAFNNSNIIHIDYCDVVIKQQKEKFPKLNYFVMDAMDMVEFDDGEFDFIIDKSLIDTTLCHHEGQLTTERLYNELHRVLKPSGRIVTISLHTEKEVQRFESSTNFNYNFIVSTCKIINLRRQEDEIDARCFYHTIAVFDKITNVHSEKRKEIEEWHKDATFNNALSEDTYFAMVRDIVSQGMIDCKFNAESFEHVVEESLLPRIEKMEL